MPKTLWIDTLVDEDITAGTASTISLMTGVSSVQTRFDAMTLLRTIIGIDLAYLIHDAGEGSHSIDLGIGVTSQDAFTAGGFPDVRTATDFPTRGWVYRARYRVFGFAADQPAVYSARVDRDIRSRRKLDNGECYLTMNATLLEGAATAMNVIGLIRQLWLVS